MTVYAIGQITIHDREIYDRYSSAFMPILLRFGGRLLVADERPEIISGEWPFGKLVILEFPDRESFLRWEGFEEYRQIAKDRIAATEGTILLVRGIASREGAPSPSGSSGEQDGSSR